MIIKVGTFNLNNLFSRFNFQATITSKKSTALSVRYEFTNANDYRIRSYAGKLIKAKNPEDTVTIANRILAMNVDVLAIQEVENIDILKEFNRRHLGGLYDYQVLLEGNDPRLIDVGILSRMPLGAITSFQTTVHPERVELPVFSRDLLEVQVLSANRDKLLFTLYNNHLKSHFGDDKNGGTGKQKNNLRRQQQAEAINSTVASRMRTNSRYIILGDMNDAPNSSPLNALLNIEGNAMVNALQNPVETRPAKVESGGHNPQSTAWTHRYKRTSQPPEHRLFDPDLAEPGAGWKTNCSIYRAPDKTRRRW